MTALTVVIQSEESGYQIRKGVIKDDRLKLAEEGMARLSVILVKSDNTATRLLPLCAA